MASVSSNRIYEDYDPPFDLVSEEGCDTILIYLPGYRKEQLRVQLTTSRILKISGERPIDGNRWRRFQKEFRVPADCDTKDITAKYEGGILYIRQPKVIIPAAAAPDQPADEGKTAAKTPPQQQAPDLPRPRPQPQPQPQPEKEAPLPEPQKGFEEEEKTRREHSEEDAVKKEKKSEITKKDEEGKDQCEWKGRPTEVGGRGGFFSELRKPGNLKRLVVSVIVVLSIGFYANYMFKSFVGKDSVVNYDQQL